MARSASPTFTSSMIDVQMVTPVHAPCTVLFAIIFVLFVVVFFFQAEDGIRDGRVTGVQTCALPIFVLPRENLRNVPLMVWLAGQDELQTQNLWLASELQYDGLHYRFARYLFEPADHLTLHFNDQWAPAAAFLADNHVDRNPPHVTYVYNPAVDFPGLGIVAAHAYWLSAIRLRTNSPGSSTGSLDAVSSGFGVGDPPAISFASEGTLNGG